MVQKNLKCHRKRQDRAQRAKAHSDVTIGGTKVLQAEPEEGASVTASWPERSIHPSFAWMQNREIGARSSSIFFMDASKPVRTKKYIVLCGLKQSPQSPGEHLEISIGMYD